MIDSILYQRNTNELVNHQHSSYKQFIEKNLHDIIQQFNPRKIYFNYDANANKHKTEVHIELINEILPLMKKDSNPLPVEY